MPDENAPVPQPTPAPAGDSPAAEGQPGAPPPKMIPYERFAEVIAERNELRDRMSAQETQPAPAPAPEPEPSPYETPAPSYQYGQNPMEGIHRIEDRLGLERNELVNALTPTLVAALGPVVKTAFSAFEDARRERDPYFGIVENTFRGYVKQGYAPDVALKLARGDKVLEIAKKMADDRDAGNAREVGRFTGERVAPGMVGPSGLTQGQERLLGELGVGDTGDDAEIRRLSAENRARRMER